MKPYTLHSPTSSSRTPTLLVSSELPAPLNVDCVCMCVCGYVCTCISMCGRAVYSVAEESLKVERMNNRRETITTLSSPRPKILQDGLKNSNVSRMLINLFQRWGQCPWDWKLEKQKGVAPCMHLACGPDFCSNPGTLLIHVPESLTVQHRGQRSVIEQFKAALHPAMKHWPQPQPFLLIEPTSYITFQVSLTLWEICASEKFHVNLYFIMWSV